MQQLVSPDTFEFFARYLLAGFVIISVRAGFIRGERPQPSERFFEAVVLSLVNQAIFYAISSAWSGLGFPLFGTPSVGLIIEAVVLPSALGVIAGWYLMKGWNSALLRRLAMPIEHPIDRAYDFAFERHLDGCFVIITYEDGTRVHGRFGQHSLAANDQNRSDIYLERLYNVDEDLQWSAPHPGRSGLVSLRGLRSIEFLDEVGETE
ncbi:MAG: DUF6338 family protein [Pseudomonadota bacterium]